MEGPYPKKSTLQNPNPVVLNPETDEVANLESKPDAATQDVV